MERFLSLITKDSLLTLLTKEDSIIKELNIQNEISCVSENVKKKKKLQNDLLDIRMEIKYYIYTLERLEG